MPLKDWNIKIYRGVLTGLNEAFIISTEKRNEILANCADEDERKRTEELIRPILRGRDIKRYSYDWAGLWLINTHNGVPGKVKRIHIEDYPAVKHHLDEFYTDLKERADQGETPYNLRNCAYLDEFNRPFLAWIELTDESKFVYCENFFVLNTVFFLTGERILDILGMLNSKLIRYYFKRCLGTTSGVGTNRWLKFTIEKLPLAKTISATFKDLVKKRSQQKESDIQPDTQIEQQIDFQVFQAYNLTDEEILFIKETIK